MDTTIAYVFYRLMTYRKVRIQLYFMKIKTSYFCFALIATNKMYL
jgi:hypothetical protein